MARSKSVVLTPAEKRSAIASLKGEIKELNSHLKVVRKEGQGSQKAFDAATKATERPRPAPRRRSTPQTKLAVLTAPATA